MAMNFGGTLFHSLSVCARACGCVKVGYPVEVCKGEALPIVENHCVFVESPQGDGSTLQRQGRMSLLNRSWVLLLLHLCGHSPSSDCHRLSSV